MLLSNSYSVHYFYSVLIRLSRFRTFILSRIKPNKNVLRVYEYNCLQLLNYANHLPYALGYFSIRPSKPPTSFSPNATRIVVPSVTFESRSVLTPNYERRRLSGRTGGRTDEQNEGLQCVHVHDSREAAEKREHRRHDEQHDDRRVQTELRVRPQHRYEKAARVHAGLWN